MSSSPEGQSPITPQEQNHTPETSGQPGHDFDETKLSAAEKLARKILGNTHDPEEVLLELIDPNPLTVRDQLTAVDIVASEVDGIDARRAKHDIVASAVEDTFAEARRKRNRARIYYRS